jgi:hypothetical protein
VSVTRTNVSCVLLSNSVNSIEISSGRKFQTDEEIFYEPDKQVTVEIKRCTYPCCHPLGTVSHRVKRGKNGIKDSLFETIN